MDATSSTLPQTASGAAEPGKRFLDPFAEWRDCANQWDVTEVWRAQAGEPNADPEALAANAPPGTER